VWLAGEPGKDLDFTDLSSTSYSFSGKKDATEERE